MSRLFVDKFLYHADRDAQLLSEYRRRPAQSLERWERERGHFMDKSGGAERVSWHEFSPPERRALEELDYRELFRLGAHYFLLFQVFVRLNEEEYERSGGPLSYQREYARGLEEWHGRPYPSVEL